jgi:hypothetical protein
MGFVVISARVAIQMTWLYYKYDQFVNLSPAQCAMAAARSIPGSEMGMVRFALHSLANYLDLGWKSQEWLKTVLENSHYGHNFRRCFFFDYKENRRTYPRVTNRGVHSFRGTPAPRVETGGRDD